MLTIVFALGAAVGWGLADFYGGVASRQISALTVTLLSVALPMPFLLLAAYLIPAQLPHAGDIAWAAAAGIGGVAGFGFTMRALAMGAMTIVAPVAAIVAAGLPVAVGAILGDRPTPAATVGVMAGMVGLVLLATRPHEQMGGGTRRIPGTVLVIALAAGVGAGVFLICISRADHATGLWPLVTARIVVLVVYVGFCLRRDVPLTVHGEAVRPVLASALFGVIAAGLYLLSAQRGLLSLVAVLASLSPAVTVLMAATVLGEKVSRLHTTGLVVAGVAVALIATG